MNINYLADSTKNLVCLVNVRITENYLLCGATVFKGGLSGTIKVYNGSTEFLIEIPDEILSVVNYQTRSSIEDSIKINYVKTSK